jgi:ATP-dependent DNA ligase
MMAKIAEEPFDSPDWIFEVKLDGYRGIAVFDAAGKPHLWSRNGLPLEKKFPAIARALSKLKMRSTILDGEVVAVDENGIPREAEEQYLSPGGADFRLAQDQSPLAAGIRRGRIHRG